MERRIAAILAADMVGYSRLIEQDEAGTLARQKRHMAELIAPAIQRHNGRIVKLTGDGLIAEFASVVDAVQCAVFVQKEMAAREGEIPEGERIQYRVAVNLGDVIFDEDDVYGDGVNIAARLEALAEPGGVVVSGTTYDLLKSNVEVGYRSLGPQRVKNIATPVRVYKVVPKDHAERAKSRWRLPGSASVLVVSALLVGGSSIAWWWSRPDFDPIDPSQMELELPEKPSLAILPFADRTGDPNRAWIAEALTETLSTSAAFSPDLVVVDGRAAKEAANAGEAARRLGVGNIVEGAVYSGPEGALRVEARLSDAVAGRVLWSGEIKGKEDEFLALREALVAAAFEEINVELARGEQARHWMEDVRDGESYRLFIEGRAAFQRWDQPSHIKAENRFERLMARGESPYTANLMLGWLHWQKIVLGLAQPAEAMARSKEYATAALAIKDGWAVRTLLGYLAAFSADWDAAVRHIEAGTKTGAGVADFNTMGGYAMRIAGENERAVEMIGRGIRLSPLTDDFVPYTYAGTLAAVGDFEEARRWAEVGLLAAERDARAGVNSHMILAHISQRQGRKVEAREHVAEMLKYWPEATTAGIRKRFQYFKDQSYFEDMADALADAGLPEFTPADAKKMEYELPATPSVVVMPFRNLSGDTSRDWIGEGLTEAILVILTKSPELTVVAGHKSGGAELGKTAETHSVRYVLEGSHQAEGNGLRVSARLSDAIEGRVLWADTFDRTLEDEAFFEIQDAIADQVLRETDAELGRGDLTRAFGSHYEHLEDYRLAHEGDRQFQLWNAEGNAAAERIFDDLVQRLPDNPAVATFSGWIDYQKAQLRLVEDRMMALDAAGRHAERALEIDPDFANAHVVLAFVALEKGDLEGAARRLDMHLGLLPSTSQPTVGSALRRLGRYEEAEEVLKRVMRTQPQHYEWVPLERGRALLASGNLEEARALFEGIAASDGRSIGVRNGASLELVALAMMESKKDEAEARLEALLTIWPKLTIQTAIYLHGAIGDPMWTEQYSTALLEAGVPQAD